jgi:hypothetical protein
VVSCASLGAATGAEVGVIEVGPRRIDVTVAVAGPDEHKILWEQLLARAPFFAKYQAKVERQIPIAVLTLIDPVGQAVPQCRFELFSGDDRGFVAGGPWIGYAVTPRRADGRRHFVQRDRSRVALGVVVEHLGGPAPDPRHLALHGTLLCTASYGAARAGNHDQAHDLLAEATATAARLGDHPDTRQRLTANITSHQVSVAHILGDPASALRHARAATPIAFPDAEREGRFLVDVALAYRALDKPEHAYTTLREAPTAAHPAKPDPRRRSRPRDRPAHPAPRRTARNPGIRPPNPRRVEPNAAALRRQGWVTGRGRVHREIPCSNKNCRIT